MSDSTKIPSRPCPHMIPRMGEGRIDCLNMDDEDCPGCKFDDRAYKFAASVLFPAGEGLVAKLTPPTGNESKIIDLPCDNCGRKYPGGVATHPKGGHYCVVCWSMPGIEP